MKKVNAEFGDEPACQIEVVADRYDRVVAAAPEERVRTRRCEKVLARPGADEERDPEWAVRDIERAGGRVSRVSCSTGFTRAS